MNRHKGFVVVALIHFVLWSLLFLYCMTGLIYGVLAAVGNPLEDAIAFGLTLVVGMGFVNSVLLFFSVRGVCRSASVEKRPLQKTALGFSVTAMVSFYVFIILLFGVNRDELSGVYISLAFLWLACTVIGGVLLYISAKKT